MKAMRKTEMEALRTAQKALAEAMEKIDRLIGPLPPKLPDPLSVRSVTDILESLGSDQDPVYVPVPAQHSSRIPVTVVGDVKVFSNEHEARSLLSEGQHDEIVFYGKGGWRRGTWADMIRDRMNLREMR